MDAEAPDDAELLRRFRQGDAEAFETFYRSHKDGLYRFLLFACRDTRTAEDLVQKTFLRLVEMSRRTVWRGADHPRRWLYRVGLNLWRDELRRRRRETPLAEGFGETVPDPRSGEPWERTDAAAEAVLRAVAQLPERHRTVVSLHHLAGLDLRETGRILGLPVGTVKSRLAKAMELLARRLRHLRP